MGDVVGFNQYLFWYGTLAFRRGIKAVPAVDYSAQAKIAPTELI
jgi:hypothetical protein